MEVTRSAIKAAFPGRTVRIRRVDFSDLARDYAYTLRVEGVNDRPFFVEGAPGFERARADFARLREILGSSPTYRGKPLLTD